MKKNIFIMLLVVISIIGLTACNKNSSGIEFKKEYEVLNGSVNSNGKEHRTITIPSDNPFEKVSAKDIVEKIENKETFYVYFGDKLCPWCRSVIEKASEVAIDKGIKKIYYVNIWDEDGNEILRDKYELKDNALTKTIDGTDEYYKLIQYFDGLLSDYTLTDEEGNKTSVGEKRIFAPNFIYVKDGKPVRLVEGISDKQNDSRGELTKEILKDEEDIFNEFFSD